MELNTPEKTAALVQATLSLKPHGTFATLLRRSSSMFAASGSTLTVTFRGTPSGNISPRGSWAPLHVLSTFGSFLIACIIRCSEYSIQFEMKALIVSLPYFSQSSFSRRSAIRAGPDTRKKVLVPLRRDANTGTAHADDVFVHFIVTLNSNCGED